MVCGLGGGSLKSRRGDGAIGDWLEKSVKEQVPSECI